MREPTTATREPGEPTTSSSNLAESAVNLDHIAVAVPDLEASIAYYQDVLGFEVLERRQTEGQKTAMVSAVLKAGPITLVLVQGTTPESQVSRYIEHYGSGVQHIAIGVKDMPALVERLKASGTEFYTTVIEGEGIRQIFTCRDAHSGMMFEFIERLDDSGNFSDRSVQELFRQLEASDAF